MSIVMAQSKMPGIPAIPEQRLDNLQIGDGENAESLTS